MILGNFTPLELRPDKVALWENFLVSERRKQNLYKDTFSRMYFWRNTQQQEIDFVEDREGQIYGFEFKWNQSKAKIPKSFVDAYQSQVSVIHRKNFREFVMI